MNSTSIESMENVSKNKSGKNCEETFVTENFLMGFVNSAFVIFLFLTIVSAIMHVYILNRAYTHIRGRTADKCLHVFLFSMAFADLILTGFCYPFELSQRIDLISLPYTLNVIEQLLCFAALIASSFSLVFLNLDKLAYFKFPLRYSELFTRRRAVLISGTCWFISFAYLLIAYLCGSFKCFGLNCVSMNVDSDKVYVYWGTTLLSSILPATTSLLVALYILNIMTAHQKQIKQEKLLCSPSHPHGRQNSIFLARMRTFYFIFMTTVFTAITLLPYRFLNIYRILYDEKEKECSELLTSWILNFMVMLNSIINPVLTLTILPQYRLQCITKLHDKMQPSFRETECTRDLSV